MAITLDPELLARFDSRQRDIIDTANEWGYFEVGLSREPFIYRGRHMLDIGMGGGPHSVPFIVGGAASYTGVDPLVGTEKVSDFRAFTDPSRPSYAAFPFSPTDIMAAFPNIRLHSGYMEEVAPQLRGAAIDLITLSAVTEHLERPDAVIKAAYDTASKGAVLWIAHANYYSWTGHHLNPRTIETWDRDDPDHNANIDWAHLDPHHPAYSMDYLNRMRLDDFRTVVDKYFAIVQWREYLENADRLTQQLRHRWRKYTTSELLARTVYVYARKRETPLATELRQLVLHHPDENYRAGEDHSEEADDHIRASNLVYFGRTRLIGAHTYNDGAGARLLAGLEPGDRVTLQKLDTTITLTIDYVYPAERGGSARFVEEIPDEFYEENHQEWTITEVVPAPAARLPLAAPLRAAARHWLRDLGARAVRLVR